MMMFTGIMLVIAYISFLGYCFERARAHYAVARFYSKK
jgi:succinate dehydrogenase hydrophobic anchor subunit